MNLDLDIEQEEKYLPPTLRTLIGQRNRVYSDNDEFFIRTFPYEDRIAMLNNYEASKFAKGFVPDLHNKLYNSNIVKIIDTKLVEKITSNVTIEGEGDENVKELKQSIIDFSDSIEKGISYMLQRGDSILVTTKINSRGVDKIKIDVYPLARYNLIYDVDNQILEAYLYKKIIAQEEHDKNVLMEHRYFKNNKYYSEICVVEYQYNKTDDLNEDLKSRKIEEKDLSDEIRKKLDGLILNKPIEIPCLGIYRFKNTALNYLCPYSNIGESQYIKVIDDVVALDISNTYREIDKNIGRGRVLVPSLKSAITTRTIKMNDDGTISKESYSTKSVLDNTFIQPYESIGTLEKNTPQAVQFDLRTSEWIEDTKTKEAKICTACGISVYDYDPTTFSGVRTATEIDELGDITAATVSSKRKRVSGQINLMLSDIAMMLNISVEAFVKWDKATTVNIAKNNEITISQKNAGLISKETAIKNLNPNWNDAEIKAELERIGQETDSTDANIMFEKL